MNKLEFLEDTIKYYSEDTSRRCIVPGTYSCKYSPEAAGKVGISDGCAIGRHCTPENKIELDKMDEAEIGYIIIGIGRKFIPIELQEYGVSFLSQIQNLHDNKDNWEEKGLTRSGLRYVEEIKKSINNL